MGEHFYNEGKTAHLMLVTGTTQVIYKDDGTIDGSMSHIIITETAGTVENNSSWRVDRRMTFNQLADSFYLVFRPMAFITGITEAPYVRIANQNTSDDVAGGLHGVVYSNYRFKEVCVSVLENGSPVISETKYESVRNMSLYALKELSQSIKTLPSGKYTLSVTAVTGPFINGE